MSKSREQSEDYYPTVFDTLLELPTRELSAVFIKMCEVGEREEVKRMVREELKRRPIEA